MVWYYGSMKKIEGLGPLSGLIVITLCMGGLWWLFSATQYNFSDDEIAQLFFITMLIIGGAFLFFLSRRDRRASWVGRITEKLDAVEYLRTPQAGTTKEENIINGNYVKRTPKGSKTIPFGFKIHTDSDKDITWFTDDVELWLKANIGDTLSKQSGSDRATILPPS